MRIVRLEYDYACNFRCSHCDIRDYQGHSDKRAFTVPDVAELAEQADKLGFGQFVISGGEPLVYKDFDAIVAAIDPQRFYITTDSNGWLLDKAKAQHLKDIGMDKVQISIDSLIAEEHDKFRHKPHSHFRAVDAVRHCRDVGLNTIIQTVVDKQRARSDELEQFIKTFSTFDIPVYVGYAKLVGAWAGRYDLMLSQDDIDHVEAILKKYNAFSHLTPAYNYPGGCIAMKRMINVMKWGNVNPCPVMHEYTLGNFFDEPLADIVKRGEMAFCKHIPTCLMAADVEFIEQLGKYGKTLSD